MKLLLFIIFLSVSLLGKDSTITFFINNTGVKINVDDNFYINIQDFQKFIGKYSQKLRFEERIIDELTGDGLLDTVFNEVQMIRDDCLITSRIISKSTLVYSDSLLIKKEEGNSESIWGNENNYYNLFPYSLYYIGYLTRIEVLLKTKEWINESVFMYLIFKEEEFIKRNFTKTEIDNGLKEAKNYVDNYKGKFIHNISMWDYDTYIYDEALNKFVLFYSP